MYILITDNMNEKVKDPRLCFLQLKSHNFSGATIIQYISRISLILMQQ